MRCGKVRRKLMAYHDDELGRSDAEKISLHLETCRACARLLEALEGADLVVVPQAGAVGEWPEGLYEAEMRVAAFQNGYFVALCNRVGAEPRLTFAGESFVCDPDGVVVARAAAGTDEILHAGIDLEKAADSHARRLFMRHRRPELYASWVAR